MKKLIVLVDDDAKFGETFREQLTYRGYECLVYRDSRTAFDAIMRMKERVSGICVDLELCGSPEQGRELIELLRMNGIAVPIIVLTNNLAGETEYALLKNGADDYVRKAHNFYPALLARFEKLWEREGDVGSCLVRGGLRYDRVSRQIAYRRKSAKVDAATGLALERLMSRPGRVCTHEEIPYKVKSELAAALESVGLKDAIRTERGIGYALEACE